MRTLPFPKWSSRFWVLAGLLCVIFLTGGGSRPDIQSLLILRPVAVLACAFGLLSLQWGQVVRYRWVYGIVLACLMLTAIHLVPLPPGIWHSLPGREVIREIDQAAGLGTPWRPISMTPSDTWNALYSFSIPLAVLVLVTQLDREERFTLLPLILALLLISGALGFAQAVGPSNGPLYLYRISNLWASVGLFANRNHQALALACCIPMLAVWATSGLRTEDQRRKRGIVATIVGLMLIPLILVTGSRAGLLLGIAGLILARLLIVRNPALTPAKRRATKINPKHVVAGAAALMIVVSAIAFSRAEAVQRLWTTGGEQEIRLDVWGPMARMAVEYFPVGSGIGGFAAVYKIHELQENLNYFYMNHAHNELIEILATGGLAAILILISALWVLAFSIWRWFFSEDVTSRDVSYGRLGSAIVLFCLLSSLVDYPARVPSLAALLVIAAVWATTPVNRQSAAARPE